MTSVETRDLSGKVDGSRVNSNTKRVGNLKSRHVDGGMFTTVAILNEKTRSFDPWSRFVLSSYLCVDSGGQACGGGW